MNIADQLAAALRAIVARHQGIFDHPDLMTYGPLDNMREDIQRIAHEALAAYEAKHALPAAHTNAISDRLCADIMSTAIEGGIGYWAEATEIKRAASGNWDYAEYTLIDAEGDEDWQHVVNFNAVRRGIALLLAPEGRCTGSIKSAVSAAIRDDDGGMIDADGADAIIQFACFGEIVYG